MASSRFIAFFKKLKIFAQNYILLIFLISGCDQAVRDYAASITPSGALAGAVVAPPIIQWDISSQSTQKFSTSTLTVKAQLSTSYPKDVSVQVTLGGSAILNTDFSTSVAAQLIIPKGQKSAVLNFSILNDGMLGPDKVLTVTMASPTNAILGTQVLHTITIVNNILGPFSISGITGPGDVTLDAFLNGGVLATVNWSASVGAANYDVTILQNDGLTVQCALVNTVATSYSFAACPLVAGITYKVKVAAKNSSVYRDASNNIYSFMVNSPPTPAVTPIRLTMTTGSVVTDVITGASCAFAGCTLAVQNATNGAGGTTSISGNNITYVPNASFAGTDSFSYVLSDGRGGSASSTINVKVMGAFTWTGAGGSTNWTAVNNWCGSLNVAQTACVGGPAPGTSGVAIFDGTCTSNCSALINASIDVGAIALNAGYTATLTQGAGFTIITEAGAGFSQSAGTFIGGNANITVNGVFNLAGGTFTSTSSSLILQSNFTVNGTPSFTHNSGIVVFAGSCCSSNQITPAGLILNTVQFAGYNKSYNLTGTLNVSGALSFNDTYGPGAGGINGGVIQTSSDITVGNWGGGSSVINVANSTARTITAGTGNAVNSLNIIASGQVTLSGTFLFYGGSYAYVGPGALVTTGSTLAFYGGCSNTPISPGSANYNNVSFSIFACAGATFSITGTMNILGTLNFNNSGGTNGTITGGTLAVSGDVTGGASGFGYPFSSNDTLIKFVGSGVQNVTGVSGVWFPSVEIASSGTVNLNGNINITKNFTYTSGVLNAGTSTLRMGSGCGSSTLSTGTAQLNNLSIANTDCTGQTYNIVGTVNVLGNLLIDSGTNGPVNGGTFNVSGSSVTFTSGYGNSSLIMTGAAQSFTQTSGSLQGNITYNKSGGTLTLATGASFNSAGQNMTISAGTVNMAGKSLAVGSLLSIASGATLTRASGALTYGSLSNLGTLNP